MAPPNAPTLVTEPRPAGSGFPPTSTTQPRAQACEIMAPANAPTLVTEPRPAGSGFSTNLDYTSARIRSRELNSALRSRDGYGAPATEITSRTRTQAILFPPQNLLKIKRQQERLPTLQPPDHRSTDGPENITGAICPHRNSESTAVQFARGSNRSRLPP